MKRIFLSLALFFIAQFSFSQADNRRLNQLQKDLDLYQLMTCVQQINSLTRSWVFIDRMPDAYHKRWLVDILDNQLPELLDRIKANPAYSVKDLPEIEGAVDTLVQQVNYIMSRFDSFESYEDPFTMFEMVPMVEEGGEIETRAHRIIALILKQIKSPVIQPLEYPDQVSHDEKQKAKRQAESRKKPEKEKINQDEMVRECEVFTRKSDGKWVCISTDSELEEVAEVDEITLLLKYKRDTLIENIEEGYRLKYTRNDGILEVSYGYGDYPEGMTSIGRTYTFSEGQLSHFHEIASTTNYWVPPDSCCPSVTTELDYYWENGEFVSGEKSYEDTEDPEGAYTRHLNAIEPEVEAQFMELVDRLLNMEIVE